MESDGETREAKHARSPRGLTRAVLLDGTSYPKNYDNHDQQPSRIKGSLITVALDYNR
jgi:hypothetical protein